MVLRRYLKPEYLVLICVCGEGLNDCIGERNAALSFRATLEVFSYTLSITAGVIQLPEHFKHAAGGHVI